MLRIRVPVLVMVSAAVTVTAAGCGGPKPAQSGTSPASSPAATSAAPGTADGTQAQLPPRGYKWVGNSRQHIRFAVPKRWVSVNLAKMSTSKAIDRLSYKGISSGFLKSALKKMNQRNAIVVGDLTSVVHSPYHFLTNVSGFCVATPLTPGADTSQALKSALRAEYAQIDAHLLALKDATINGDPGAKAELTITSGAGVTVYETQYLIFAKDGRLCTVTMTTDRSGIFQRTFSKIGGTIHAS